MMSFFEIGRAARQYHRTLWLIWLFAGLLIFLVGWHVINLTQEDRIRQIATTERDLANLTRVSQEHANRTFRSADQVVRFVQSRYLELGNQLDLTALTRQGVIDAEIFNQVGIIDNKGIYILANIPITGKLDLSDREHFKVHVTVDKGELFVSKPVIGRASGKWSIQLTRRINLQNGQFGGVVVLSIDPRYFTNFYGELSLGKQGLVALYGLDGIGRARRVGNKDEFGKSASQSQLFDHLRLGKNEGSFIDHSKVDGVERLYYFRRIPNYQLVVIAGVETKEMLANHVRARDALWLQAGMLMLLIVILAGALTRFLANLRRVVLARAAAQQQVQERTDQLDAIFALSPDGFVSFDQAQRITHVNSAFCQMTELTGTQLEGMNEEAFGQWLSLRCVSGTPGINLKKLHTRVDAGQTDARELIEVDTTQKRMLQVGLRCNARGLVSQILYFRDVTVETQVDTMKSEFIATAAHELRTPMTSILGFTELLLMEERDPETRHEFLSIVLEKSTLMANILDELLDLARIEARRGQDFHYTLVNVQELVTNLCKSMSLPAGRTPPELTLPAQPLQVMADARKLQQAVMNVLTNAYKYSNPDAIVNKKVSIAVTLTADPGDEQQVSIAVTDGGMGMTPEQCSHVFDRFYRADTSGKVLGTGLGMSIVKEIIELHQGHVCVDSVLGQGTCVTLYVPTHTEHLRQ